MPRKALGDVVVVGWGVHVEDPELTRCSVDPVPGSCGRRVYDLIAVSPHLVAELGIFETSEVTWIEEPGLPQCRCTQEHHGTDDPVESLRCVVLAFVNLSTAPQTVYLGTPQVCLPARCPYNVGTTVDVAIVDLWPDNSDATALTSGFDETFDHTRMRDHVVVQNQDEVRIAILEDVLYAGVVSGPATDVRAIAEDGHLVSETLGEPVGIITV
jgi:hypothetical protein